MKTIIAMAQFTVKDIMSTNLVTVSPDDDLVKAYFLLKSNKIRQLPVCSNGKIKGIITDRDIRQVIGSRIDALPLQENTQLPSIGKPVSDCMTKNPITIAPETPIEEAITLINTKKFGSLPVCQQDRTLIGIITITDISGLLLKILREDD